MELQSPGQWPDQQCPTPRYSQWTINCSQSSLTIKNVHVHTSIIRTKEWRGGYKWTPTSLCSREYATTIYCRGQLPVNNHAISLSAAQGACAQNFYLHNAMQRHVWLFCYHFGVQSETDTDDDRLNLPVGRSIGARGSAIVCAPACSQAICRTPINCSPS